MKSIPALLVSLIIAASASAETKFPRGSFEMADLDKAKALAATEKKDLAFIYTDKTTTCGLCQGAAEAFIDAVKSKAVIVYVDSKASQTWWPKLSEPVRQALSKGKFIPVLAVTDPGGSKVTASLTYEAYKEDNRKSIRELKKTMKAE